MSALSLNRREIFATIGWSVFLFFVFALGFVVCCIVMAKDWIVLQDVVNEPEPEHCALCGSGNGIWYHAPCVVDLARGTVVELQVYDGSPTKVGEIAPHQSSNILIINPNAGFSVMRIADEQTSKATVPKEKWIMTASLFCYDCRRVLMNTAIQDHVLVDMHDLENIQAYPIEDGAVYEIRDYTVTMEYNRQQKGFDIEVTGHLFDE